MYAQRVYSQSTRSIHVHVFIIGYSHELRVRVAFLCTRANSYKRKWQTSYSVRANNKALSQIRDDHEASED